MPDQSAFDHTGDPNRHPDIYNSASVIAPTGAWTERYNKIHTGPFGEYVPFAKLFGFASGLPGRLELFARGKSAKPLDVAIPKAGVLICYEFDSFPMRCDQFAQERR